MVMGSANAMDRFVRITRAVSPLRVLLFKVTLMRRSVHHLPWGERSRTACSCTVPVSEVRARRIASKGLVVRRPCCPTSEENRMSRAYWACAVASNRRSRASGLSRRSSRLRTTAVAGLFIQDVAKHGHAEPPRNLTNIDRLQDTVTTLNELVSLT
jgi:hypothetical protein